MTEIVPGRSERVHLALFRLGQQLKWQGGAIQASARRVKLNPAIQPCLYQVEHAEDVAEQRGVGGPQKIVLSVTWLIYHNVGGDPDASTAPTTNAILDSVKRLFNADEGAGDDDPFAPPGAADGYTGQTLDGLVYRARIVGRINKFPGDLEGQALIVVPLKVSLV